MQALLLHEIAGQHERLRQALDRARALNIGAIFVTGNLIDPSARASDPLLAEDAAAAPYVAIFDMLASLHRPVFFVPGEHDAPLPVLSRALSGSGALQITLVHRCAAYLGDGDAVAGFGGALVDDERASDSWRLPAWEARVAFEHLAAFNTLFQLAPRRMLLFSAPPRGGRVDREGEEHLGQRVLNGIIRVHQPHLVVCGGPQHGRGSEQIEGALVVNPGELRQGSYALIDLATLELSLQHLPEPLPQDVGAVRTILVALDGSPPSWHALEIAASMARSGGGKLILLHAFEHVSNALGHPYGEQALEQRVLRGERLIDEAGGYLGELPYESELLEGPPAEAIVRVAETHKADLIVMGARGGGLRLLLGSVSQKVLRHAPCSVLITRQPPEAEALQFGGK